MTKTKPVKKWPANATGVDPRLKRPGGLSYIEIPATNARQSAAFYQFVLGWDVDAKDPDHPKFSDQTAHLIGRWKTGKTISHAPGFFPYFYVDRIDYAIKRVAKHGGQIVKPPFPEGGLLVSTVRDPAGNLIGLWQDASQTKPK